MDTFAPREARRALRDLGARLRRARLLREDSQAQFAARMQVSVSTLQAMERGEPSVSVGFWASAIWVFDRLEELDRVLALPDDPEARFFEEKRLGDRRRARHSRRKHRHEAGRPES